MTAVSADLLVNVEIAGLSAVTPGNLDIDYEVVGLTGVTANLATQLEIASLNAVSSNKLVNIEIADGQSIGGTPESILNLPTFAVASRLRADFYDLQVVILPKSITLETVGPKVGTAPLLSVSDFNYSYKLDEIGTWEILVPANDERLKAILDGDAKIIKIYYEDTGHVFTGFVEDYEIVDQEVMRVFGTDMMGAMAHINSMFRIDTRTLAYSKNIKYWRDYYRGVLQKYMPALDFEFEDMPPEAIFVGDPDGEFIGIVPTYQSQSILEVLRDFNASSGVHFRIHPALGTLAIGEFGDDSGKIIAPIGEDDVLSREQGALVLHSFSYVKTKEELINQVIPQGSNDSFGIAVELRHAERSVIAEIKYLETSGSGVGAISLITDEAGEIPLNLIPKELLDTTWETHISGTSAGVLSSGSGNIALIGYDPIFGLDLRKAVAIPFSLSEDFYVTFACLISMASIGKIAMAIAPKSGGNPDTSNLKAMRFDSINYFNNELPRVVDPPESDFDFASAHSASEQASQRTRTSGDFLGEVIGFMDKGMLGDNGFPWPLLVAGDYYLVVWMPGSDLTIGGFNLEPGQPARIAQGSLYKHLNLFCNARNFGYSGNAKFLNESGTWDDAGEEIVMSIHGWSSTSDCYAVEGMLAEAVHDNGSGHRVFFMRDFTSIKEYGLRQAAISFPSALDASDGIHDLIPASNLLHDQACEWLRNHAQPFEKLTVTCTGLFSLPYVGQEVRFVYRGMALNENGEYKWLDINSLWVVLDINWHINNEGLEHTLTLTNIPDDLVNPRNLIVEFARHVARSRNNMGELHIASRRLGDGVISTS